MRMCRCLYIMNRTRNQESRAGIVYRYRQNYLSEGVSTELPDTESINMMTAINLNKKLKLIKTRI